MASALPLYAVSPTGTLADNAPFMLHTRLSEMLSFAEHIHDVNNVTELHNMRIASKRLRYTLEIFAPVFDDERGPAYNELLDTVRTVQEQLGEIHDFDVRVGRIAFYLQAHAHKRPEIRIGLQNLIDRQTAARAAAYVQFEQRWRLLNGDRHFEQSFLGLVQTARSGAIKATTRKRPSVGTLAS